MDYNSNTGGSGYGYGDNRQGNTYGANYNQGYGGGGYGDGGYGDGGYGSQHNQASRVEEGQTAFGHGQNDIPLGQPSGQTAFVMKQDEFLASVKNIRKRIQSLTNNMQMIGTLRQRALAGNDPNAHSQLETLITDTQTNNNGIRNELRQLKTDTERTTDGSREIKKRQFEGLQRDFKKELEKYLEEERNSKERYREQIARQYRIVNPAASEDEVRRAADADWDNEGVFQQALRTNRSGQANAVLGAVRARHNEMQRIEQSIQELAMLFQDLDTMVVMQEATVVRAEEQTEQTNVNLTKGNEEVSKANEHARRRRKLKWWCLIITVLIVLLAIGLGVGLYFGKIKVEQDARNAAGAA